MAPNLEENALKRPASDMILFMSPLPPAGPLSDDDDDVALTDFDSEEDDLIPDPSQIAVPLEHNLRALLVKVTGTEDLDRVTQVKLRVIARDVPLQHLSVHIPALRELILDGSVVSSFRDLGCGLKNLKILKLNRCSIEKLDAMLAFEGLEELHVGDNLIEDCMPCAFLTNIKVLDLRRNRLKNMVRTLPFLTICEKLEHIYLEGNDEMWQFPKYRQTVKSLLPALRTLDGTIFTEEECKEKISPTTDQNFQRYLTRKSESHQTTKTNFVPISNVVKVRPPTYDAAAGFTIKFPPKIVSNRPGSSIN